MKGYRMSDGGDGKVYIHNEHDSIVAVVYPGRADLAEDMVARANVGLDLEPKEPDYLEIAKRAYDRNPEASHLFNLADAIESVLYARNAWLEQNA